MTATAAEALELALWLHRAPARRAALVGRPLPDGVAQLLRVAGGSPDQVAAAATITGEDEATILEAVRFYLQQILFYDDADAYRVLGLTPGAPQDQAREHHRLLQQWLHPDRRGQDQWESAYSVKVNRAWTQLRTPQSRAAYDANLATAILDGSRHGGERPAVVSEAALRPEPPARHRSRNLTLLVLLACAGLLALIALQNDRPPEWRDDRAILGEATRPASEVPDGSALVAALDVLATETAAQVETATTALAQPVLTAATADAALSPPLPMRSPRAAPHPDAARHGADADPARAPATVLLPPAEMHITMATPAAPAAPAPAPTPKTAPPRPIEVPIPDPLARMRQARQRANEVLAFLGDPSAIQPPVWNDVATAEAAAFVRLALQSRLPAGATVALQDPQWRLSSDGARLESGYRADSRGRADETGRITVDFVWREDRLLVRHLELTPR